MQYVFLLEVELIQSHIHLRYFQGELLFVDHKTIVLVLPSFLSWFCWRLFLDWLTMCKLHPSSTVVFKRYHNFVVLLDASSKVISHTNESSQFFQVSWFFYVDYCGDLLHRSSNLLWWCNVPWILIDLFLFRVFPCSVIYRCLSKSFSRFLSYSFWSLPCIMMSSAIQQIPFSRIECQWVFFGKFHLIFWVQRVVVSICICDHLLESCLIF